MIRIAVDTLGGDHSPDANIEGALTALAKYEDLSVILFGDEAVLRERLAPYPHLSDRIEIVHAPEAVSGEDKPIDAIRLKKDSSMIRAIRRLREDESVGAAVSSGATGVLVGASILRIGRISGVHRPAFCPILPTMHGGTVGICDSGATVEADSEQIFQNAVMASVYLSEVFGIPSPRVGLLNVGVEPGKGDEAHREAYEKMKASPVLNFVGNMESRDLLSGKYDLVACDGFSGNVLLKSTEGALVELLKLLKRDITSSLRNKIGGLFLLGMFKKEKEFLNYQNYGGSVLLGLEKLIVKGHGSSNATAFAKCIEQAYGMVSQQLNTRISAALAASAPEPAPV